MKTNSALHHSALKTRNVKACALFYAQVLGLVEIKRNHQKDGRLRSVWFDLNGVILMIEEGKTGWHLAALSMNKKDRKGWRTKLTAAGVKIDSETEHTLYFTDPEGNRLALSHYPD